jgi:Mg-chelatase subunit ChlD
MTGPPAASMPGGPRQRPRPKSGRPEGGTVGRHELSRHARFAEISPEVGVLDERALHQALADDPTVFELLGAMTAATDERLRAAAIRLSASIVLERARSGRVAMRGISRLRPARGAADGDLDIDASIEGVSAARTEARPVSYDDLTTVHWAIAPTAFAVVVDRSGSMLGARLAAAATVAAACALRAPQEHAVLSFAGSVEVIRPLAGDIAPALVAERLLRLRGHGVTRLAEALKAARQQLAQARAPRQVVILLSDCRSTDDDDTVEIARGLPELIILAPAGDHEGAAYLADLAGARWAAIAHPLDAAAALDRLLETRAAPGFPAAPGLPVSASPQDRWSLPPTRRGSGPGCARIRHGRLARSTTTSRRRSPGTARGTRRTRPAPRGRRSAATSPPTPAACAA